MAQWHEHIQALIDDVDRCILSGDDEVITLRKLAQRLGYSESYVSRKFSALSGMQLWEFLRLRKLAFALRDLRDTDDRILDIALKYGYASHEAFTRAFKEAYGVTPGEYRQNPAPVALRTVLRPFDCYLLGVGGAGMAQPCGDVKAYFVTLPAHRFLHIRNYESIGYWDFWQKQSLIPGQDRETICRLLRGIRGILDDVGGNGQVMAFINAPEGRICSWGIPLAEAYGVRLPCGYAGEIPAPLQLMEVPEGEYIVFEHGPFDVETENAVVEEKIERAMKAFCYAETGYCLDTAPGRVFYFFHDSARFWKYIRPVRRVRSVR